MERDIERDSVSIAVMDDLVSVREAAKLLRISESTAWRWINQHRLPAYRVGQKRVYVKRADLATVVEPARSEDGPIVDPRASAKRMTPEESKRTLAALAKLKEIQEEMLTERGGKPWIPAWKIINQQRELRSRQLQ
jgi:excisionase family DNA binding protein